MMVARSRSMDMMTSNASVNTAYAEKLRSIAGVQSTLPVIRYITPDNRGRWGIRQVDGVEWQAFSEMNGIQIVEGRAPLANDEIVMDRREMQDDNLKLNDQYELFGGKPYKIVGIFEPPSGARIKMSLAAMQEALQTDKCTYILVKIKDGADPGEVAANINTALPGNKINLTRDLVIDAQERIPGLLRTGPVGLLVKVGRFTSQSGVTMAIR